MTRVDKVIKLSIEADEQTSQSVDGQSRICNWLYNHLLEKANTLKQEFIQTGNKEASKTLYTERGLRNLIPSLKKEFPFLKSVHSSPLKNTALRLSHAIQTHQKTKKGKQKGKSGWPKYRAWKAKGFSLFYDEPNKGFKIQGNTLKISLGADENKKRLYAQFSLKEAHRLNGYQVRSLRIKKEGDRYYALFSVQVAVIEKKPIKTSIALDPNHKNLVYGVDTNGNAIEIAAPHFLKKYDKRLDELKSKRDRCQKKARKVVCTNHKGEPTGKEYFIPSRRWKKYDRTLKRALHKRREQTNTFMYTAAHALCQNYDYIGIGDYTPQGDGITTPMRRAMNNRSLIGRFKEILLWTATKSGKTFIEYDEKGTTRTCCHCGHVLSDGLCPSIRQWCCPTCQTEHIRDENAARNGLQKILRDPSIKNIVPSSGLVSVKERWAWRVLPSGMQISRGKEQRVIAASRN